MEISNYDIISTGKHEIIIWDLIPLNLALKEAMNTPGRNVWFSLCKF